ncbi:MAG: HDOD domain-containing protein [Myxococcota bacterium]
MSALKQHPKYGRGEHTIEEPGGPSEALASRLRASFRDPGYRPPQLPEVGVELLQMSRDPDVDLNRVLKLLERDALLAASILRVARSPVFAGSAEVVTLHQALMRLGLSRITEVVLQTTMNMEVFRAPGYEPTMKALAHHAAVTAHLTRYICSASDIPKDYAFLCGLLLNVGISASLSLIAHRRRHPPPVSDIWPTVEELSPEAGFIVVRSWKLPASVGEVIRLQRQIIVEGNVHRVAAAASLADGFATEAGFGPSDAVPVEQGRDTVAYAARMLRIDEARLKGLRTRCHELAKTVEA